MGRNRGANSRAKRAATYAPPSQAEREALHEAVEHQEPTICAIVGVAVLDLELGDMIRARLRHKDDEVWGALVNDTGPLQSFHQKIEMAHAMGIFDERTRTNLHILRRIRNIFAHPKKLVTFSDEFIVKQLRKVAPKGGKFRAAYTSMTKVKDGFDCKNYYATLCYLVIIELSKKRTASIKARTRRMQTSNRMAIVKALMGGPSPLPSQAQSLYNQKSLPGLQAANPKPQGLLDMLPGGLDKLWPNRKD